MEICSFLDKQPILPPELEQYDHIKVKTENQLEDSDVMDDNIKKVIEYLNC